MKSNHEILLVKAKNDLTALEGMLEKPEKFSEDIFGFHAQQCVEKTIKAYLSKNEIEFKLTHNLGLLFNQVRETNAEIADKFDSLRSLRPFAVEFRYDIEFEEGNIDRRKVFDDVNNFYKFIEKIILE